jgi:hypothetical protein
MKYLCTPATNLHELIGHDSSEGFQYGPLSSALKAGEELVFEESHALPRLLVAKVQAVLHGLFIVETEETLLPATGFCLVLH